MLQSERYADDSNTKKYAEYQMGQAYPDAAYQYPYNIHEYAQASAVIGATAYLPAERP